MQLPRYTIDTWVLRSVRAVGRTLGWLRTLVSPVYFTRDAFGGVQQGIRGLPLDRPLLFVGTPPWCSL